MMLLDFKKQIKNRKRQIEVHFKGLKKPLYDTIKHLVLTSDFALRHIALLKTLIEEDDCLETLSRHDYRKLIGKISLEMNTTHFAKAIRLCRHRHLLRLLLRREMGLDGVTETMQAWSIFADEMILRTLAFCEHQLQQKYGQPLDKDDEPAELLVLAMGKLGGNELNFSSDVDLIFAFSKSGTTDGDNALSNESYYQKVMQLFIQMMQQATPEGMVFRVDLRLRPNGDSGPLVCSLTAMETYYQEQGRDWERYAMVKARLLNSHAKHKKHLQKIILPFVYRRYVDFTVIESLRSMKAMIDHEVRLQPDSADIKKGRGGIREVEFMIQSFQLIRGGRLPQLQQQNAMQALQAIQKENLLTHTAAVTQAYYFLRDLENMLQMHNDQQTHALPTNPFVQLQIASVMGFQNWQKLTERLAQYRRIIHNMFHAVLGKADIYEDEKRLKSNQLANVWQGHVEADLAINLLISFGFENASECYKMLQAFRVSPRCVRLTQTARLRLDRFMMVLLNELSEMPQTDKIVLQVVRLLENIVARSAYLALLAEKPQVLRELLYWFQHSSFITGMFVNHPFLLEVLVDQEALWQPPGRQQLLENLQASLAHCTDMEQKNECLGQFKLTSWLLAARAELYGQCHAVRIAKFLANVSEVILQQVLLIACEQLEAKYPEIKNIQSQFAIIAYGKLGSREMNYDSDVDLVFLHAVQPGDEALVIRLTQKILHMLTLRTQTGVLYAVDTRLRPSGSAGLLVSHIDAFVAYQQNQAWTWEHQALLRARMIVGNQAIRHHFLQLKETILTAKRAQRELAADVHAMREKIGVHTKQDDVKHIPGGLIDLEFLVQFLVLATPKSIHARHTHTMSQINQLLHQDVITLPQYRVLQKAYRQYHHWLHQQLLNPDGYAPVTLQGEVAEIYETYLKPL